ncbi:MAG TPA: tetratricopeptide repeat protein [Pyrinomonadaceae bacterium]|nr:tetratricopeptide repeat protein [Pyrinomonadaceae bacterium]
MNLSSQRSPRALSPAAFFVFAALFASANACAQTRVGGSSPRATTYRQSGANVATQAPAQSALTPRERRAQAYAKLLEGQRYYEGVRSGTLTEDALLRAKAAFQQAADLEPTLAEAHTALAEIWLLLDDIQRSQQEGQAAARINPDNYGAHQVLARDYTLMSKLAEGGELDRAYADKAVAELREVIRVHPNDAEGWALLAEFNVAGGNEKEAIEDLRKWATLPASIEGRFYQLVTRGRDLTPDAANARLGEVLLRAGRPAEAVAAIRRAVSMQPDNTAYLQLLGEALEAGGTTDQSVIEELQRVAAQQPQNAAVAQLLARAEARAGRVDAAVQTIRNAIANVKSGDDQNRLTLQLQLAQVFDDAARYDEAVAVYEDLLKSRNIKDEPLANDRDRRFAVAVLSSIAGLRQRAGQADQALAAYDRIQKLLPDTDPTADILKAEFLRSNGRREEALAAVRDARKRFPDEVRLLRVEAQTLAELGRSDEALGLLRPRLKGDASDYEEYLFMSSILISAGRGADAVEAARKALQLAPADEPGQTLNAQLMLSSAQERAGDVKGSEETLRQVLAKDPNNATALNNLGYFLSEHGERLDEARSMIERAVRAEPSNASFLDSLGWVNFKLGKLKEAERYLSDAARRNPSSATIQEHLGDLFQKLGQQEKAQASWRKALSLTAETADSARIKAKLNSGTNK